MLIEHQGRNVVRADVDEEKNQNDLDRIEDHANVENVQAFVLIQQDGHCEKGGLDIEEEPGKRELGRQPVQHEFVIRPAKVGDAPNANADSDYEPKGLCKTRTAPGSSGAHGGRQETGENLQQISEQGTSG